MHASARRRRLRDYLQREGCIRPASVFDPISSRIAYALGFEVGMLGGSVASAVTLGAPDLAVMTLTELAEQVHRITRASDISQMVDADNGYGNALNVIRTIRELEDAGASGMTIEDTNLPSRYGSGGREELIPLGEMMGKLSAAVQARQDSETVVLGRTHAINATSMDDALSRVANYHTTGIDAIFLMGIKQEDQLVAMRKVTDLPFMLGSTPETLTNQILARHNVKIVLRGHNTFTTTIRAIYQSLQEQANGNAPTNLADREPTSEMTLMATGSSDYELWKNAFLSE